MNKPEQRYRDYRRELDEVLLNGTPALLRKFMIKHGQTPPKYDKAIEVVFHKTVTAAKTLPIEHRRKSRQWLDAHGYHALDDGDL